ncbi:MAG: ATP-grasp domain-containing protein, partial [Lentilactobacillus parabuchneri]|nr:ATP-grasp domain-containing protein [Lentilactobacillus parabuchneri]
MFKKVLVANRGEIAVQIIRALHDMNITAVAVYSSADKDSLFVRLADEAICIGGPQPSESYLNMAQIISAANLTGCEAIHPGYGFLSENAEFAELCETCHIKFIGPSHELISLMGDKSNAREAMKRAGVPVIPGSEGVVSTVAQAKRVAEDIGYPVLLKSAAGGGGKGIREVDDPDALQAAFEQTQQEARLSYDDEDIYVEKLIRHAKHVEMQVIADTFGNVVYLPERDCSLQRNHQKVIEESPCLLISPEERKHLGEIVSNATLKLGYTNTGTYE